MDYLKRLYQVETLDARFASKNGQPLPNAQPSRSNTREYWFYYLCLFTIPVFMVKTVYDLSGPWHFTYARYEPLLSDGWIPGRKVDNSDAQYNSFRDNIPYLAVLILVHPLLRRLYESRLSRSVNHSNGSSVASFAAARQESRISFDAVFGAIFLIALHGVSSVKVLLILYANYQVATALPKKYVPAATWIFNIGILFANELSRGFRFSGIVALLLPHETTAAGHDASDNWGAWVDGYGGLIPRWEVLFNITVLRLISFNFDYHWSLDQNKANGLEKKNLDPAALTERDRVSTPPSPELFTFRNYVAYTLYAPLYLAGPILTFNDYMSQSRYPLSSISPYRTGMYAVRFLICLLAMELVLHYLYVVAISKADPDWSHYTPLQLSLLAYFNLHVIWLKLLLPWRFFRLWSLVDGIDPPENMVRCATDNYSTQAFWRGWHRSFNLWIIRYIYIPLGGSHVGKVRSIGNFLAVFTFVALWHDINLRLLVWGWLITLFVVPEFIATVAFPPKSWKSRPDAYRMLTGVGGVANLMMLMVANLVGFAVGLDGLKGLVMGIVGSLGGRLFLLAGLATTFVSVQLMFEWRESEKRRGVSMKC